MDMTFDHFIATMPLLLSIIAITHTYIRHRQHERARAQNDGTRIRTELIERCDKQDQKIDALTVDLEAWKSRYYDILKSNLGLQNKYDGLLGRHEVLQEKYEELQGNYDAMWTQLDDISSKFLTRDLRTKYGLPQND